jgi:hypothetical protein
VLLATRRSTREPEDLRADPTQIGTNSTEGRFNQYDLTVLEKHSKVQVNHMRGTPDPGDRSLGPVVALNLRRPYLHGLDIAGVA